MRKAIMFVAAFGLAMPASFMIPTAAQAGFNHIPQLCKTLVASGNYPNLNHGECESLITSEVHFFDDQKNGNVYAEHACDFYAEEAPDFFNAMWVSKQQCMDEVLSLP